MTIPMHPGEVKVDETLLRRLLTEQFPAWGELPLRAVEPRGTDNAVFRIGCDLVARLPRVNGRRERGSKELEWLPRLAACLPVDIPVPVGEGRPGAGYPWFWEIYRWVNGETLPVAGIDAVQAAHDLGALISALQRVDPAGAPPGRGVPLAERDESFRFWLERFVGDARVGPAWDRALAAPPWEGPPVWHHGDLDARNWLVREGRIRGVVDWSCMGVGDPACDLMVAWKLHSVEAYHEFREATPADEATWERARGWVVSQAVAILAYYTPENNPILVCEAESWLELALSNQTH